MTLLLAGSEKTLALRVTSPAIDKGDSFGNLTDQRGFVRPFDDAGIPNAPGGNGADIGAIERNPGDVSVQTFLDFDGDGKTDVSVFGPSVGEWWYLRSSYGGNRAYQFGSSSDQIVPVDFTGDGKTDIAFWRQSSGDCLSCEARILRFIHSRSAQFETFSCHASGLGRNPETVRNERRQT